MKAIIIAAQRWVETYRAATLEHKAITIALDDGYSPNLGREELITKGLQILGRS